MSMTIENIKSRIEEGCSHFTFEYDHKTCGIDPVYNPKDGQRYEMWYGDEEHTAKSVDEVMSLPIFGGKTLEEIYKKIDIIDW